MEKKSTTPLPPPPQNASGPEYKIPIKDKGINISQSGITDNVASRDELGFTH